MAISIKAPLSREAARKLRSGDSCLISGVIYTARDAAHKRLCELVAQGKELPLWPALNGDAPAWMVFRDGASLNRWEPTPLEAFLLRHSFKD